MDVKDKSQCTYAANIVSLPPKPKLKLAYAMDSSSTFEYSFQNLDQESTITIIITGMDARGASSSILIFTRLSYFGHWQRLVAIPSRMEWKFQTHRPATQAQQQMISLKKSFVSQSARHTEERKAKRQSAGEDLLGQSPRFGIGEAHVVDGVAAAPRAFGSPQAPRSRCYLSAIGLSTLASLRDAARCENKARREEKGEKHSGENRISNPSHGLSRSDPEAQITIF
ncbi:hypothetical protein ACLOJK_010705 [Asimina triloba]